MKGDAGIVLGLALVISTAILANAWEKVRIHEIDARGSVAPEVSR